MKRLRAFVALVDLVGVAGTIALATLIQRALGNLPAGVTWSAAGVRVGLLAIWLVSLSFADSREPTLVLSGPDYYARSIRATFGAYGFAAVVALAAGMENTRLLIGLGFPVGVVLLTLCRWVLRNALLRVGTADSGAWMRQRVLTVLAPGAPVSDELAAGSAQWLYESVGTVGASAPGEVIEAVHASRASMVLVSRSSTLSARALQLLGWDLDSLGVSLCIEPGSGFIRPGRTSLLPHPSTTVLLVRTVHLSSRERFIKRTADLFLALVLFPLLLPVMIAASVAIALEDGGPVLFAQTRIGRGGKRFTLYKLRTMYRDAEDRRPPPRSRKAQRDPRCTRVGAVLRRWSIDEIPQLWCVLVGSMSLVGPRPRLETEFAESPEEVRRLEARPGVSGLWQTSGRSDLSFEEADLLDVEYVDNWSLIGDLVILARTVRTVIGRRGAY